MVIFFHNHHFCQIRHFRRIHHIRQNRHFLRGPLCHFIWLFAMSLKFDKTLIWQIFFQIRQFLQNCPFCHRIWIFTKVSRIFAKCVIFAHSVPFCTYLYARQTQTIIILFGNCRFNNQLAGWCLSVLFFVVCLFFFFRLSTNVCAMVRMSTCKCLACAQLWCNNFVMPDKHEQFGIKRLNTEQDSVTRTMINKNYF